MASRKLSAFQQKPWMDKIAKNRKYKNQAKGEGHWKATLTTRHVKLIRWATKDARELFCRAHGISERHWYMIRAGKRWAHVK